MRLRTLSLLLIATLASPLIAIAATSTTTYSSADLGFSFDYPSSATVTETTDDNTLTVTVYSPTGAVTILRTPNEEDVALTDPNTTDILIDGSIAATLSSMYTTDAAVFAIPDTNDFLSVKGSGDPFTTILETLHLLDPAHTSYSVALDDSYSFAVDIPVTWEDDQVIAFSVDNTDSLGSYTEWDFYLPTTTSTNAYQLSSGNSSYYGRVFVLRRYMNPNNLSVVAWQNAVPATVTSTPTAIATDGTTVFTYLLDTNNKQYTNFLNDIGAPLDDAVTIVSSFHFVRNFSDFFSDVPAYDVHRRAVEELSVAGIISGYSDGTFEPDQTVNRAELTKILVEGLGISPDAATYNHCFPDVTTQWYAPSVCYAQAQGWVQGYPDAKFHPEKTVNKAEALKMVVAANGFTPASELSLTTATLFSDTPVTEWYAPYLKTALDRGLIEEPESDLYLPADGRTRGSIAEMIFRVRVAQSVGVDEYMESYRDKVTTSV